LPGDESKTSHQLRLELEAARRRIQELESAQDGGAGLPGHSRMLETLLANAPDYIYFKDRERRFVLASHQFCALFRRSLDQIIGKTDEELFPAEVSRQTVLDDQFVISSGTPLVDRVEGGESVGWVLTNKVPWRDEAGTSSDCSACRMTSRSNDEPRPSSGTARPERRRSCGPSRI
jgi:PAS domain-containing protein